MAKRAVEGLVAGRPVARLFHGVRRVPRALLGLLQPDQLHWVRLSQVRRVRELPHTVPRPAFLDLT